MRFLTVCTVFVFLLMLCLAGPVEAKGGKGGGGQGKSSLGGSGKRGGQRVANRPSHQQTHDKVHAKHGGGKTDKQHVADSPTSKKDKLDKKTAQRAEEPDSPNSGDDSGEPTTYNKKEKQLANFQRQRDKKIAQAEHLREIAERNGNANLLANADRMEAQALSQYERKVAHLEKFGVTDPALDPDGGVLDPLPDGDPLVPGDDPLVEYPLDEAVGVIRSLLPF
jgi:hypothetical protein